MPDMIEISGLGEDEVDYSQGLPTPVGYLSQDEKEAAPAPGEQPVGSTAQKDLTFFLGSGAVAIGYEFVAAHFYGKSAAGDRALMGGSALTHGAATYFSYKFLTNPNSTELGKVLSYIFGAVTGIVALGSLISMFSPGKPLPPSVIRSVTRAIGAAGANEE